MGFGKALLATGANVNILRVEGRSWTGSTTCARSATRTASAGTRRRRSGSCWSVAVASPARWRPRARALDKDVAIVCMEDVVLSRGFGDEVGRWFQELLESKGVEIHAGETLAAYEGDEGVGAVVTESGKTVEGTSWWSARA